MRINPALVERCLAKANRFRFDPKKLLTTLGEGDRSKRTGVQQREQRFIQLLTETGDATEARLRLERVLGGNDLSPVNYLERGTLVARSICRVRLRDASGATVGFGTGSLVAPGVMLTNHHVIGGVADAGTALAEFDYELDVRGEQKPVVTFAVRADPAPIALERLDFCLAAISPRSTDGQTVLTSFGWLPLNPTPGKAFVGEYLSIIQHPGGELKQVCVRENKLLKYDEAGADTLWYNTDTVAGSSGSPVFNNSWQVVALHHSGVPKTDAQGRWLTVDGKLWNQSMDESRLAWIANEGIRISRILGYLATELRDHPLARAVLQAGEPTERRALRAVGIAGADDSPDFHPELVDGQLQVVVPLRIAVQIGRGAPPEQEQPPAVHVGAAIAPRPVAPPVGIESVDVDQSDYDKRTGYRENFLGNGALRVPLPGLVGTKVKGKALSFSERGKKTSELKYWTYSVVLHSGRRLAIFSAANVDANQRPSGAGRDGDRWYFDKRIGNADQTGPEFYGAQKTFEADRTANPFDRGHLTRRLDAQWGANANTAKRNGDDSFHWTNCAPQHYLFNQGSKRWLGLEDYVIQTFASQTGRATVINGPVLDAPLSRVAADGRVLPDLSGKRHADPVFGDVAIPKLFFKIVACERDGSLAAAAFLMSQEDLLGSVDRLRGMPALAEERLTTAEARLYQVRAADLGAVTGLDFGPLAQADVGTLEVLAGGPREIRALDDVRV
jgi:endonuclease G